MAAKKATPVPKKVVPAVSKKSTKKMTGTVKKAPKDQYPT
jgi:hypothetical protein